ncbi:Transposon Ty3-I Gag-Pol polyprotein [Araneus ventricosus]|uniref:Transposon Ty3-I Gag-Pol polyprotein n=1 Tax=Araneus ventricosus TaxID=182803 RepID=A0A4Y2JAC3_ARAVE|nr:Transposon Ty3-I Gag-Pol polyprotein [Araneus ventricosus]
MSNLEKPRSRSASRTRTPVERHKPRNCWYHWRFGDRASKCSSNFVLSAANSTRIRLDFITKYALILDFKEKLLTDSLASLQAVGTLSLGKKVHTNSPYFKISLRFPELFDKSLSLTIAQKEIFHYIETRGQPVHSKVRRLSPEKLKVLKTEFDNLLRAGIIVPSKSQWSSPVHFLPETDWTWRICGDYRRLNAVTLPDRYPIPHIHDFTHFLHGKSVFCEIDMVKAYHQITIFPADVPKTAVITPLGLYEHKYMCFGLRNAAAQTFQRCLDSVIRDLDSFYAYLDDIVVASPVEDSHKRDLESLFQC